MIDLNNMTTLDLWKLRFEVDKKLGCVDFVCVTVKDIRQELKFLEDCGSKPLDVTDENIFEILEYVERKTDTDMRTEIMYRVLDLLTGNEEL